MVHPISTAREECGKLLSAPPGDLARTAAATMNSCATAHTATAAQKTMEITKEN
jgi:hypothetical protein